jgi:hypothetical protein
MGCCNNGSGDRSPEWINEEAWKALRALPAFRYLKAPVEHVSELYEKYPHDNERGTLVFVFDENQFYTIDIVTGFWYPTGQMSAFDVWVKMPGNAGKTEQDFMDWITNELYGLLNQYGVNSLYDLWLMAGNTGSLSDFLNAMRGPAGAPGATGAQGPPGADGIQMSAKKTAYLVAGQQIVDGNYWKYAITDTDVTAASFVLAVPSKSTEYAFVVAGGRSEADTYAGGFYIYTDQITLQLTVVIEYVIIK